MVTLSITQDDIDRGVQTSAHGCPIARAAVRQFGATSASASSRLYVYFGCSRDMYALPDKAIKFMQEFDDGKVRPGPTSFPLELVEARVNAL